MAGNARHTDEQVLQVTVPTVRSPAGLDPISRRDWITIAPSIGAAILPTPPVGPGNVGALIPIACLLVVGHRCARSVIARSAAHTQTLAVADQERQKIEPDPHDGAQRRLIGLGIKLELAAEQQPATT